MAGQAQSIPITPSSDVYAFGVLLLELFSGRKALDPSRGPQEALLAGLSPEDLIIIYCAHRLPSGCLADLTCAFKGTVRFLGSQISFAPFFCTKTTPWRTWTPFYRYISASLPLQLSQKQQTVQHSIPGFARSTISLHSCAG